MYSKVIVLCDKFSCAYTMDGMSINTWFLNGNGKTNVMKLFSSDWRSS